jgi:hypothetical protein
MGWILTHLTNWQKGKLGYAPFVDVGSTSRRALPTGTGQPPLTIAMRLEQSGGFYATAATRG